MLTAASDGNGWTMYAINRSALVKHALRSVNSAALRKRSLPGWDGVARDAAVQKKKLGKIRRGCH